MQAHTRTTDTGPKTRDRDLCLHELAELRRQRDEVTRSPRDQSEICFAIEQTTRELARCDNAALRMQLFDAVLRGGDAPQRLTAAQHAVASEAVRRARARDVAAAWPALADALDDASPSTSKPSLAVPPRPPRAMR